MFLRRFKNLYRSADGGSVTWYEPTPARTTTNQAEVLPPGIVQVYEGSSAALNWNYSLTLSLGLGGVIKFNDDVIVSFRADGSAGTVTTKFQERFSLSSTLGRASLFIYNVTVTDDKASGEFSCELIDSNADIWKRAIQVEVIGKLESGTDQEKQYIRGKYCISLICLNGYVSPNWVWDVHS